MGELTPEEDALAQQTNLARASQQHQIVGRLRRRANELDELARCDGPADAAGALRDLADELAAELDLDALKAAGLC